MSHAPYSCDVQTPKFYCGSCKEGFPELHEWGKHLSESNHGDDEKVNVNMLQRDATGKIGYRGLTMNCTAKDIIEKRRLGYIPYYHTERKSIRFRESKDDESDKCANVETKFQSNYSDYAGVKSNDNSGANKSDRYQSTSFHSEEELLTKLSTMLPGVAKYLMSVEEIHAERIMDMLILMQKEHFPVTTFASIYSAMLWHGLQIQTCGVSAILNLWENFGQWGIACFITSFSNLWEVPLYRILSENQSLDLMRVPRQKSILLCLR